MKIAAYARCATYSQWEVAIEDQFRRCELIARQNGIDVSHMMKYYDNGLSGSSKYTLKRQGYQSLLTAWEHGDLGVLIVTDISRLSRDFRERAELANRIERTGIWFLTADGVDSRLPNWQRYRLSTVVQLLGSASGSGRHT
ncbi:MAG: hypothetical protein CMK32_06590 [Porticoccaceae bacterium]|nr:hypothetical protein [Porticoccaceae bacterium]